VAKRKRKKTPTKDELVGRIRKLAAEGKVEFAAPPPDELVPPVEFRAQFAREILHRELDSFWASGESDLMDFAPLTREQILAALLRVYCVDCSDMKTLNLWRVMQRCMEGGHC